MTAGVSNFINDSHDDSSSINNNNNKKTSQILVILNTLSSVFFSSFKYRNNTCYACRMFRGLWLKLMLLYFYITPRRRYLAISLSLYWKLVGVQIHIKSTWLGKKSLAWKFTLNEQIHQYYNNMSHFYLLFLFHSIIQAENRSKKNNHPVLYVDLILFLCSATHSAGIFV